MPTASYEREAPPLPANTVAPNAANAATNSSLYALQMAAYGPNSALNPRPDQDTNPELHPIPMLVRELFGRAREARRNLLAQWKRNYRALNNRDYRIGATPWEEEPAISQIWPVVASAVSWMTDQRPGFEVMPTAEPFSEYWDWYEKLARDMNVCLMSCFQNYSLDGEITKLLWDAYTYGIGYAKTQWEAPLADGLGDTTFRRVDPFTIYPDPYARGPHSLTYIIEAKQMTIEDVDRAWPGAARLLSATFLEETDEAPHKLDDNLNNKQPRMALGAITGGPTSNHGSPMPSNYPGNTARTDGATMPTDSPIVTLLECYVRGYKTVPHPDQEDVTCVYDDWRCIVVVGNVVLVDKPCSEISAYNTHPYDRLVVFDTGEWYGPCIVEFLTPIQRLINWVLGSIVRNIYLMGNPVLRENPMSASRNKRFTNRPGQRLEGGQETAWLDPPQMHPNMSVDLIPFLKSEIETISGLSAMVRGFAPTGRNAQGVLDSVQDAAFVRVRASLRELERTLRGVGQKMAANIAEFYTEPRLMSLIGPLDGQRTHLSLQARHFYARDIDDEMGKIIPLRFSLVSDSGSQLPTSKQARAAEAKHLFELGAIDLYELLKAIQWPSYALVAQRVMEQQAQMAQAAAMAGQVK